MADEKDRAGGRGPMQPDDQVSLARSRRENLNVPGRKSRRAKPAAMAFAARVLSPAESVVLISMSCLKDFAGKLVLRRLRVEPNPKKRERKETHNAIVAREAAATRRSETRRSAPLTPAGFRYRGT